MATGRNPWTQASLKDETFRAFLADPDFLLSILPISRELHRILKRIFCIDPMRRIGLADLKERIRNCKYFTRTEEVEYYEHMVQKARRHQKKQTKVEVPASTTVTKAAPTQPRSISPAIWQQRIDPINEKQENSIAHPAPPATDSILTTMLTTLVI
jgi:hypothetical protein